MKIDVYCMKGQYMFLIDDGTLDTVVQCELCGKEERFSSLAIERDETGHPTPEAFQFMWDSHEMDCQAEHEDN